MQKLLEMLDPSVLMSGVAPSAPKGTPLLWETGRNIVFRNGGVEKMLGWQLRQSLPENIQQMEQVFAGNEARLFLGSVSKVYLYTTGTPTEIGSGFTAGTWSFVPWGTWLIASNGVQGLQIWKNTGTLSTIANVPFTFAKKLLRKGPHILAFNTSDGSNFLHWCAQDNPEGWDPDLHPGAGFLPLREFDDEIKSAALLGDVVAVYSTDTVQLINYLGNAYYFGRGPVLDGVGAFGKDAVVDVGRRNFGWGPQGIWVTDGVTFEYIDQLAKKEIGSFIRDNLNVATADKIQAVHNEYAKQVVFYFPSGQSTVNNMGVGFDYVNNAWTIYDHGFVSAVSSNAFGSMLGVETNKLHNLNTGSDANGVALEAWIQTKPLHFGDSNLWKTLQKVEAFYTSNGTPANLKINLGTQTTPQATVTWLGDKAIADELFYHNVSPYFVIRLSSTALGAAWNFGGAVVRGIGGGKQST